MNLLNKKLDQLERLEAFLAKIEAKGLDIYKPTIEATKIKINELIEMIPTYVNDENEEHDEQKDDFIITTETLTRQEPVDNEKLETPELVDNNKTVNPQTTDSFYVIRVAPQMAKRDTIDLLSPSEREMENDGVKDFELHNSSENSEGELELPKKGKEDEWRDFLFLHRGAFLN
jgi:hypothetical protein